MCGTDVEIVGRQVRLGAPGQDAPGARPRIPGPRARSRPERRAQEGRSGGRHRPPSRPRAVPELRGRRVGHVPQRPVHRARHQGDRRLHVRALADRARVRDEGRRPRSGSSACCWSPRPSSPRRGSRSSRSASAPSGSRGPCSSPGPGRSACSRRSSASSAGWTFMSSTGSNRAQAGSRPRPRRDLSLRHGRGRRLRAGRHRRMHGRRAGHRRRDPSHRRRAASCASPASAAAAATVGPAMADVAAAAVLKNNVVVGSVNANKRHWYKAGAGPGSRRPRVAGASRHAARAAGRLHARARSGSRTTSR